MYSSRRCFKALRFPAEVYGNGLRKTAARVALQKCFFSYTTHLFDELPQRTLSSLKSQLAVHARGGSYQAVWDLFRRMHCASLQLDAYTFTPVLNACSALPCHERGKQVHSLMINVSWNALISSYLRKDLAKEAHGAFGGMRDQRVEFSEFTLCSVLKACNLLKASRLGKQIHGLVIAKGRDLVVLCTALIHFYSAIGDIIYTNSFYAGGWRGNICCGVNGRIQKGKEKILLLIQLEIIMMKIA